MHSTSSHTRAYARPTSGLARGCLVISEALHGPEPPQALGNHAGAVFVRSMAKQTHKI